MFTTQTPAEQLLSIVRSADTPPNAALCAIATRATSNCALLGFLGAEGNFADTRVDWRVVVDYRISPALLVYGSIATGFKGGGVNPRPLSSMVRTIFSGRLFTLTFTSLACACFMMLPRDSWTIR